MIRGNLFRAKTVVLSWHKMQQPEEDQIAIKAKLAAGFAVLQSTHIP
jgi:hypothetical protein